MTIIDELADVIDTALFQEGFDACRTPPVKTVQAVLDHLAAKAGDVRGMLVHIGQEGELEDMRIDHDTLSYVLDLRAECIAPVIGALIGQGQTLRVRVCEPEPVVGAWMARQANGIVGELRGWFGRFDEDMRVLNEGDQPVQSLASHAIREKHIPELRRIVAAYAHPDEPIADPAARAKAVARILRGRGLFADYWKGHTITLPRYANEGGSMVLRYLPICLDLVQYAGLGPRAIADAIQAEEARRAHQWAGDDVQEHDL